MTKIFLKGETEPTESKVEFWLKREGDSIFLMGKNIDGRLKEEYYVIEIKKDASFHRCEYLPASLGLKLDPRERVVIA